MGPGQLIGWRAIYLDARTPGTGLALYDSATTLWKDLPATGLLVVVAFYEHGRTIYDGADWITLNDGEFRYIASTGWDGYEPKVLPGCQTCIKRGDAASDDVFDRATRYARASTWP